MKLQEIDKLKNIKEKVVLITIIQTKGSVPRNKNVSMVISKNHDFGSIGGGELEFRATKEAYKLLNINLEQKKLEYPLGPSLGQCCGGFIKINLIKFDNGKKLLKKYDLNESIIQNNKNLYIFGAGHVGSSLVNKLDGVGFNIFIVDSREKYLSKIKLDYAYSILAKDPEIIINNSPKGSFYVIMTHSHQIDLQICAKLLKINNFSFIGLIGSNTKKMRFRKRLKDMGFNKNLIDKIECPIGKDTITGKEPDVIAISIIAQLLEFKSSLHYNNDQKLIKLVKG